MLQRSVDVTGKKSLLLGFHVRVLAAFRPSVNIVNAFALPLWQTQRSWENSKDAILLSLIVILRCSGFHVDLLLSCGCCCVCVCWKAAVFVCDVLSDRFVRRPVGPRWLRRRRTSCWHWLHPHHPVRATSDWRAAREDCWTTPHTPVHLYYFNVDIACTLQQLAKSIQEALLLQRDCVTRFINRNLVNWCTNII